MHIVVVVVVKYESVFAYWPIGYAYNLIEAAMWSPNVDMNVQSN